MTIFEEESCHDQNLRIGVDLVDHPSYSPDLTPSDFFFFPNSMFGPEDRDF